MNNEKKSKSFKVGEHEINAMFTHNGAPVVGSDEAAELLRNAKEVFRYEAEWSVWGENYADGGLDIGKLPDDLSGCDFYTYQKIVSRSGRFSKGGVESLVGWVLGGDPPKKRTFMRVVKFCHGDRIEEVIEMKPGAILAYANMNGADLSGLDLSGADCYNVCFANCDLRGTHFDGADMSYSCLGGAVMDGTTSFKGANMGGCAIGPAQEAGANLQGIRK
jgi:hypothetical protein